MTDFIFTPSNQGPPFTFQPVLDGQNYTALVQWLAFGQRWYLSLYEGSSVDPIFNLPLIGSPGGVAIQSLSWNAGLVSVVTDQPHGYRLAQTVKLTIAGCAPDAYNGVFKCLITSPQKMTYALDNNPGQATTVGQVSFDINMAEGYFSESTLVYREASQTFEVRP